MSENKLLPTQYVRLAMNAYGPGPEMVGEILHGTDLSPEIIAQPQFRFGTRTLWAIIDNLSRLFGPGFFLNLPAIWSLAAHTEYGGAIRTAPTLGAGLAVLVEFMPHRYPFVRAFSRRDADHLALGMAITEPCTLAQRQVIGAIFALHMQTLVGTMVPHGDERIAYRFADAAPAYAERLAGLLRGPVSWGHPELTVHIPAELLDRVAITADAVSFAAMVGVLRGQRQHAAADTVAAAVRDKLGEADGGQDTAASIAQALGLAQRTLERRLAEEGTTFRAIHDEVQKARLLALARDPRQSAETVADRLGYHDASSLQRACRRWFGTTFRRVKQDVLARRLG